MDSSEQPTQTEPEEKPTEQTTAPRPIVSGEKRSHKRLWTILTAFVVLLLIGGGLWLWHNHHKATPVAATKTPTSAKATTKVRGLQLDTTKNYGNKYANGLLPVGDGKYVTTAPKQGYVYACSDYARNLGSDNGGAQTRGPWFTANNTEYDVSKKLHVIGNVMWQADFSNTVSGTTRTIVTNDLPSHPTGIFPIQSTDPAYAYDRNPNTIQGQTLTFALTTDPAYNETPNCMSGTVGIMLTGVQLNSAFDAGGRDAGAWEVQDSCDGHPQDEGVYHYHTLSSCIKDVSVHTVIGYALDGYPITGPQVNGANDVLTTSDLDECHGIVSSYTESGKTVTGYHYVMTEDFPYSISCYRGTPIQPPGMQGGSQGQPGSQPQNGQPVR